MSRLQAMELLVATVREGSFSAAGRRAGLSPASVSRHIGELEATLGVQLLNRTTRHLSLTEAGKIYAQRVEQILHSIEDAEAAALALQKTPRGTLRVHSRTMFGTTVLTPLLPRFQKHYPELKVELLPVRAARAAARAGVRRRPADRSTARSQPDAAATACQRAHSRRGARLCGAHAAAARACRYRPP